MTGWASGRKSNSRWSGHHDWVLCIDTDERVSEALQASLRAEVLAPKFRAYAMARCNRFMGRWLRHGEGYRIEPALVQQARRSLER